MSSKTLITASLILFFLTSTTAALYSTAPPRPDSGAPPMGPWSHILFVNSAAGPFGAGWRLSDVETKGARIIATSSNGILQSDDNGDTWATEAPPILGLSDVAISDNGVGVAVGLQGGVARTTDGGVTWREVRQGSNIPLRAVAFVTPSIAVAVGASVLRTTDGGLTWSPLAPPEAPLMAVAFTSRAKGLRVGGAGRIEHSIDAGATWHRVGSGTTALLYDVAYFNATTAVALGHDGVILRSSNAGASWQTLASPTRQHLTAIAVADSTHAIAVGFRGTIIRTDNAGLTWTRERGPTTAHLSGASVSTVGQYIIVGWQETLLREVTP